MRRLLVAVLLVCSLSSYSWAAILVSNANGGAEGSVPTLEVFRTGASFAGRTAIITSTLGAAQSNISGAWPADRSLRVEKGGKIANTTTFTLPANAQGVRPSWWGAVEDGTTDDTVALARSMAACNPNGVVLNMPKAIKVVSATAAPYMTTGMMIGSNMVGDGMSTITISGTVGFNLNGIANVTLRNLNVEVTGSTLTNNDAYAVRNIFYHSGTNMLSVNVDNMRFYFDTAGDNTGATRGGTCMEFNGASRVSITNVKAINVAQGIRVFSSSFVTISNVRFTNFETGVYLDTCQQITMDKIVGYNTQTQSHLWIGKNYSTPVLINGHDLILQQNCNAVTISDGYCEWPIERMFYLQSSNMLVSNCLCVNGNGYKMVGTDKDNRAFNVRVVNCHVRFDNNYGVADGPATGFQSYWIDDIIIDTCSVVGTNDTGQIIESFMTVGTLGTVTNLTIKNCYAKYVYVGLLYAYLLGDDTQSSYIVADGVQLINNVVEKAKVRAAGSLLSFGTGSATQKALATYAARNVSIRDNRVILATTPSARDDFFYQIQFINTLTAANNTHNLPWQGSSIPAHLAPSGASLASVAITGTGGQFSCTATTLIVGDSVDISGTLGGTGTITGYTGVAQRYYIIATNGTTTFTLSGTAGGSAIVTTAGTPTGLTYSHNSGVYTAVTLKEPRVMVSAGGGTALITKIGLLETVKDSFINLVSYNGAYQESYLVTCIVTGKLKDGVKEFTMWNGGSAIGAGSFWNYGAALTGIVEVTAPAAGKYIGKLAGATLTDLLSTPPVTLTPAAGDFTIRGDTYAGTFTVKITF